MKDNARITRWALRILLVISVVGCGNGPAERRPVGRVDVAVRTSSPKVEVVHHRVPHVSTMPATAGQTVELNLAEFRAVNRAQGEVVVMLHGATTPSIAGFDLATEGHYGWARWLAQAAGLDVFVLDQQGFGLSERPAVMDDPCNVAPADQARALIPNPLEQTCPPTYPYALNTARSDWDELDTAVNYVRTLRGKEKVHLVGWSQGSFRAGPYSVMHPEKVKSVFLFAPLFNPPVPSGAGPGGFDAPLPLPRPGPAMTLRTKADLVNLWASEPRCEGQLEPGIEDRVWSRAMEDDPVGRGWGPPPAGAPAGSPPEGVLRVRQWYLWGWNTSMAERVTVPLLILQGQFDGGGGGVQRLAELYDTVKSTTKLRFRVQCAGHFMQWESQRRILHHISKEWIKHLSVAGFETGEFFVDTEGNLLPCVRTTPTGNQCAAEL